MTHVTDRSTATWTIEAVAEVEEELQHHLELLREDALDRGLDPLSAHEEALRRFGDPARHLERCIAVRTRGSTMWLRISIVMNILLALGLLVTFVTAKAAFDRVAAGEMAALREAQSFHAVKDALRRSIWAAPSGQVLVEGAVARPGTFGTSFDSPLSLRELITLAGGPLDGASTVSVRQARQSGESTRKLADLYGLVPVAGDCDPGPGDVVIVR